MIQIILKFALFIQLFLNFSNAYPVNTNQLEKREEVTTVVKYFTTNVATVLVHATPNPTPSSDAASLSSAISSELASKSSAATTSSSSSSSASTTASAYASAAPSSGYYNWPKAGIKGVNLGGWLVLEPWINTELFSSDNFDDGNVPDDEFNFCETLGDDAGSKLEDHYSSWITEDDFKKIASYGLNAVRIPIGYWAYKLMSTDKYYKGSQDKYLEKAIGWARDNEIFVLIDLHGAPGSQNGYDSSGHKDFHDWNGYDNIAQTYDVLQTIFDKYGGDDYKDVVIGIELINEPLVGGDGVSMDTLSKFYSKFLDKVDTKANVILHDGYQYQGAWTDESYVSDSNIVVDTHLYMLYDSTYIAESFDDKIKQVCTWGDEIGALSYKEFVGEFTAAWNSDSSSIYTETIDKWGDDDKKKIRKFVEAQFTAFENSYGWFFWNWKMGNSDQWDFQVLVENDIIPQPLSDRKYSTC